MTRLDLETLFEKEQPRLQAVCLRMTGDPHLADEAVQETWLAALRALKGFRGEARPGTWLYRIAVRQSLRVRARWTPTAPLTTEPPSRNAAAPSGEATQALLRALAALPVGPRTVLALTTVEGLPQREVAAILGIPEGTVWSRLAEARRALTEALSDAR